MGRRGLFPDAEALKNSVQDPFIHLLSGDLFERRKGSTQLKREDLRLGAVLLSESVNKVSQGRCRRFQEEQRPGTDPTPLRGVTRSSEGLRRLPS